MRGRSSLQRRGAQGPGVGVTALAAWQNGAGQRVAPGRGRKQSHDFSLLLEAERGTQSLLDAAPGSDGLRAGQSPSLTAA